MVEIDRRERPRAQDRARNYNARGRLLVNHQIGPDGEHRRLQGHAQDFGNRAETSGDVASALIARKIILVGLAPAFGQPSGHSHRDQHFRVSTAGGGQIVAARRQAYGLTCRDARHEFGDDGEGYQNDGADQRGQADQEVESETDRQIEWQPRQIEERARPHAAEERADVVQIAQRLKALIAPANDQRQAHNAFKHPVVEGLIERGADAPQDSPPDQVENTLGDIQSAGDNNQTDKRRYAPAWQHPVVNLEHENRPGQIEQVDHAAHGADADERAATGAQRITEFGTPDTGNGCHQS